MGSDDTSSPGLANRAATFEGSQDTALRFRSALNGRTLLGLLLAVLLAWFLRVWQVHESLWLDELHTAWVVDGPADEIPTRARIGNQSPLYFMLVWITTSLCGFSELGLRLSSLIAGVALVPAVFLLAGNWTGSPKAALCAALLVGWDRNFIFYAQEARAYALLQLIAVIQLYLLWRLSQTGGWRRRSLFVLTTVCLFYLHYTAVLLLIAEYTWLVFVWAQAKYRTKYRFHQAVVDLLCIATMVLPLLSHLVSIASRRAGWELFIHQHTWTEMARWFSLTVYLVVPSCGVLVIWLVSRTVGWRSRRGMDATNIEWYLGLDAFTVRPRGREGEAPDEPEGRVDFQARQEPRPPRTVTSQSSRKSVRVPFGASTTTQNSANVADPASNQPHGPRSSPTLALSCCTSRFDALTGCLVLCWLTVPWVVAWLVTTLGLARLFFPRYLLASAAAPIVMSSFCVSSSRRGMAQNILLATVLGASLLHSGILQRFSQDQRFLHDRNQDWRAAVQHIESS